MLNPCHKCINFSLVYQLLTLWLVDLRHESAFFAHKVFFLLNHMVLVVVLSCLPSIDVLDKVFEVSLVETAFISFRLKCGEMFIWIFLNAFFKQLSCHSIASLSCTMKHFFIAFMDRHIVFPLLLSNLA